MHPENNLGSISFEVKRDPINNFDGLKLHVTILNCQGLPNMDNDGSLTDSYVKLFILPGEEKGIRTDTIKDDLNPVFNKTFSFVLPGMRETKEIVLQVFDSANEERRNDEMIGEARLLMKEDDTTMGTTYHLLVLQPMIATPPLKSFNSRTSNSSYKREMSHEPLHRGSIKIRVKGDISDGSKQLNLTIIDCKDLPNMDANEDGSLSDPYVKIFFIPGEEEGIRTETKKDDLNPVFNRPYQFLMPKDNLIRELVLQVFDSDDNIQDKEEDDKIGEARILLTTDDYMLDKVYRLTLKSFKHSPPKPQRTSIIKRNKF